MKRIVICADGTWNQPDQEDRGKIKPSNVLKMARAIWPTDTEGTTQVVFYDEGVGSSRWLMDRVLGGAMGIGLDQNILDAYRFLSHNYQQEADGPADEVFLFGFSRGAYTVRSLAGMLNRIGLLPKDNIFYLSHAFDLYRRAHDQSAKEEILAFRKKQKTMSVNIKCIGVWDTVGSLGIPLGIFQNSKYQFHDTTLGDNIENAYHALAIDEKRKPFAPTLWQLPEGSSQTLEQAWFAGVHTNIGGGYDNDGLANCAFNWMVEKAQTHGLEVNKDFTDFYGSYALDEIRNSFTLPFSLMGKNIRTIGTSTRGNEDVHPSAIERMESEKIPQGGHYWPENLKKYLRGHP